MMTDEEIDRLSKSFFVVNRTSAVFILMLPDGERVVRRLSDTLADRLRVVLQEFRPDDRDIITMSHHEGFEANAIAEDGKTHIDLLADWDDQARLSLMESLVDATKAESFRFN